jgi:hypothetical protein
MAAKFAAYDSTDDEDTEDEEEREAIADDPAGAQAGLGRRFKPAKTLIC